MTTKAKDGLLAALRLAAESTAAVEELLEREGMYYHRQMVAGAGQVIRGVGLLCSRINPRDEVQPRGGQHATSTNPPTA